MVTDLMPLVDEVHKLRNENAVLRKLLDNQAVRMDDILMSGGVAPAWVTVTIPHMALFLRSAEEGAKYVEAEFARAIVAAVPSMMYKTEAINTPLDSVRYSVAFLAKKKL